MKEYKLNLDDIMNLKMNLSNNPPRIQSYSIASSSEDGISKHNASVKKIAEENIIGLLQEKLSLEKLFNKYISKNGEYHQCTIKLIEVGKYTSGIYPKNFLYEKCFFKGDTPKEEFEFKQILQMKSLKYIAKEEDAQKVFRELKRVKKCTIDFGNDSLEIGSNKVNACFKSYYLISLDRGEFNFKKQKEPITSSGIYLYFRHSKEEIDGILSKDTPFAIDEMLFKFLPQNEFEIPLMTHSNYKSNNLLVSVKGNADFEKAFLQIIKHSFQMKFTNQFKLETKIPFLLICHSDNDPSADKNKRFEDCKKAYSKYQEVMQNISLTVIYLKTNNFFGEDYIYAYDVAGKLMKDQVGTTATQVNSLNTRIESLENSLATSVASLNSRIESLEAGFLSLEAGFLETQKSLKEIHLMMQQILNRRGNKNVEEDEREAMTQLTQNRRKRDTKDDEDFEEGTKDLHKKQKP